MASLLKSFLSPICENCGAQPKYQGHDYCGKTCAMEAEKKKKTQRASRQPSNPVVGSASPPRGSSPGPNTTVAPNMCRNCGVRPKFGNYDHCGKKCADEAEKKKKTATAQTTSASGAPMPAAGVTSAQRGSSPAPNAAVASHMCQICGVRPKFQGYDYCGKTCTLLMQNQLNTIAQTVGTEEQELNAPGTSSLCENCFTRAKSTELDEDGTTITHPYCGIRCYQASQRTSFPASTIPAPAATIPAPAATDGSQDPFKLKTERMNGPVARKILLMVQDLWQSESVRTPQLKGIYRIDLPLEMYRRFDLALQMNGNSTVTTTYYGGVAACNIADDTDPAPCASDSCDLCAALRSSFGNVLHGASCRDGSYGFGLYTYSNPGLAHDVIISGDDPLVQNINYALVQCRVVTQADYMPSSNSYAGFIDDSGVVFCAHSMAVIPTYLLIYRLSTSPNSHRRNASSNTNSVSGDDAVNPIERGGKARGNAPLQKPQRQLPPRGASLLGSSPHESTKGYPPHRPGRLASSSYESGRASSREAMRQSSYPLPAGNAGEYADVENDDDRRTTTASASKYAAGRPKAWNPRLDEDDDDFY